MPLYEYECDACGHRFEVIQKYSDAPIAVCPKCGGSVHKLLSSPAIQFKGSGFYITDYARAGKANGEGSSSSSAKRDADGSEKSGPETNSEAKGEAKETPKSESKSDGKTETKSESKTTPKPSAS
jgi:putative FmdB family regulatory protein